MTSYILIEELPDGSKEFADKKIYTDPRDVETARKKLEENRERNIQIVIVPEGSSFSLGEK